MEDNTETRENATPKEETEDALLTVFRGIQSLSSNLRTDTPRVAPYSEEWIDGFKGTGLVATVKLQPGSVIIQEIAMIIKDNPDGFVSWAEYDIMIGQELRTMPNDWKRKFFEIPAIGEDIKGKFAARFDFACIPCDSDGRQLKILGMAARNLNHGCIPNAYMTFSFARTPASIIVRACKNIEAGEEITIPYCFTHGEYSERQSETMRKFGFQCACRDCLYPKDEIEGNIGFVCTYLPLLMSQATIEKYPAVSLKFLYGILRAYTDVGVYDGRYTYLLVHAAYICAHHSDAGRATWFLRMAQAFYLVIETVDSSHYALTEQWLREPTKIAGWGQSTRGFSDARDVKIIEEAGSRALGVAFMLYAKDNAYITLEEHATIEDNLARKIINDGHLSQIINELQQEKDEEAKVKRQQNMKKKRNKNRKKNGGRK
ncbi:hypothetical protein VTO42DRAFT_6248 [Malbranchea cinnamomea]